ncbi:MAG: hypothetical protein QXS03_01445 [Candidatus Micrarchaeaceae archaeon]
MIEILVLSLLASAFVLVSLGYRTSVVRYVLYLFSALLLLVAALGISISLIPSAGPALSSVSLSPNTLYQNANYSTLTLYALGNSITAYLGANATSLYPIAEGSSLSFSVPHGFWFKLNYTTANVIEVYER